ncbi:MAG: methyltransferase domain-containing protein [Acidimicrobiales bacterium]|nr:methyltransferase domain-containing protein [Acidimicrobiales bacterium]
MHKVEFVPEHAVPASPVRGRVQLAARFAKWSVTSAKRRWFDFTANALKGEFQLLSRTLDDLRNDDLVQCNLCGWTGAGFYPNTGAGFHEPRTTCPGCLSQDRYRTLLEVLRSQTTMLAGTDRVVEVAPCAEFQELLRTYDIDYASFDLLRPEAMEQGDITAMRFADGSVDWFLCYHVLEHIPDDQLALKEIHRVLKPAGTAVLQVPYDFVNPTREFGFADPRDVHHVRLYGTDFADIVTAAGFDVRRIEPADCFSADDRARFGFHPDPIYFATKR